MFFVCGWDCVICFGGWGWRRGDSGGYFVGGKLRKLLIVSLKVGGLKVRIVMKRSKYWKYLDMFFYKLIISLIGYLEFWRFYFWCF